jgi:acyl carrier protein
MTKDEYRDRLTTFVAAEFMDEEAAPDLTAATPLVESGVLDSLRIAVLLTFIRDGLGVHIPLAKIDAAHFKTIDAIADLLTEAQPSAAGERAAR